MEGRIGCIHKQGIDTAASWHAADFVGGQSSLVYFFDSENVVLDQAGATVTARRSWLRDFGPDNFGLSGWVERLRSYADEFKIYHSWHE